MSMVKRFFGRLTRVRAPASPVLTRWTPMRRSSKQQRSRHSRKGGQRSRGSPRAGSSSSMATRDLWWTKLSQVIGEELDKEAKATNIQVLYYDAPSNVEYCKTVTVGSRESAQTAVKMAVEHLDLGSACPVEACGWQLWVRATGEESPYPLVGHERPLAIKMKCLREAGLDDTVLNLDHCNNVYGAGCQFLLRRVRKEPTAIMAPAPTSAENNNKKGKGKTRRSPLKIQKMFRRSKSQSVDSGLGTPCGQLFGLPLARVSDADMPPKPVVAMLQQLFLKGPFTHGIFRRSANARLVREVRERLDSGLQEDLDAVHVVVVAALFKDFLRSLPDALLGTQLYDMWLDAADADTEKERLSRVHRLCQRLPMANVNLLRHFLCVLHHIARRSADNMMSAANLAVCVGPSLLWSSGGAPSSPSSPQSPSPSLVAAEAAAASRAVPSLVQLLIERCVDLFGSGTLHLFGAAPERDLSRQDSGAEESDSLHSSGGHRRDDSSIDSLEREFLVDGGEPGLLPRQDKMSLTNLSRDSGLTMSDSQLYTPDEEESESTSSGHSSGDKSSSSGYGPAANGNPTAPPRVYSPVYKPRERPTEYYHTKLTATYSHPGQQQQQQQWEGQNGTVVNSHFQRHDWFRRKSHLRRGAPNVVRKEELSGKELALRRSASEESILSQCSGYHQVPKRPAMHRKGRAPPPPVPPQKPPRTGAATPGVPLMPRSKSAHNLDSDGLTLGLVGSRGLLRSTPHIVAGDCSYDSSTLSDDDSTPHVSRSNSRGKDCGGDSFSTASSSNASTLVPATPPPPAEKQRMMSAKAKQLYEESLRIYREQGANTEEEVVHAAPVRVDSQEEDDEPPRARVERRGRSARRGWTASRSKSLPPAEHEEEPPPPPTPVNLRSEISWCVSELRALYDRHHGPPPYRPPPPLSIPSHRAPITSYHLGNSQSELYVTQRMRRAHREHHNGADQESNCGEESYV